jgi:hypothetical protein
MMSRKVDECKPCLEPLPLRGLTRQGGIAAGGERHRGRRERAWRGRTHPRAAASATAATATASDCLLMVYRSAPGSSRCRTS